jgi:hypothetical protein
MGRKPRNQEPPHDDPFIVFITAVPWLSIKKVAKLFAGRRGHGTRNLQARCTRENWLAKRKAYQAEVRRLALDEIAKDKAVVVARSNERHIKFGEAMEGVAVAALDRGTKTLDKEKDAVKLLKVAASLGKTGVDINRKGLGLADQIVYIKNVREITVRFVRVLEHVLSGHPDLLAVARSEIHAELSKAEDDVAADLEQ